MCGYMRYAFIFRDLMKRKKETGILVKKNSLKISQGKFYISCSSFFLQLIKKSLICFRNTWLSTNVWNSHWHIYCDWYRLYHLDNLHHKQKVQFSGVYDHKAVMFSPISSFKFFKDLYAVKIKENTGNITNLLKHMISRVLFFCQINILYFFVKITYLVLFNLFKELFKIQF